jgi:hypothetical protein
MPSALSSGILAAGGEQVSSKDIAAQLRSVAPYLKPQGGGVTCSGGEPLLQPDFVSAIFREAHAMGLTTCLDTTGQGSKHHHWCVYGCMLQQLPAFGPQQHMVYLPATCPLVTVLGPRSGSKPVSSMLALPWFCTLFSSTCS